MDRPPDLRIDVWLTSISDDGCDTYSQALISEDPDVVRALRDSGTQAHVGAKVLDLLDEFAEAHVGEQYP